MLGGCAVLIDASHPLDVLMKAQMISDFVAQHMSRRPTWFLSWNDNEQVHC